MNTLRQLVKLSLIFLIFISCGSSERVITDEGKIYNVDGKAIKKNGVNVSSELDASQKEKIDDLLNQKEEQEKAEAKRQKELEKAIETQEKIENDAKERQRELKSQLDALQDKIRNRQNARDDYAKIKKRFVEQQKELEKLKSNGQLSSIELKEWEAKLKKLEVEAEKAQQKLNKF
ncbi:hypothetical protein [uncultured Winogradskyella sp.]|uniref:hypothetical protein n=1 Tax=uncultured Winogradskyella sp. TaxID=395353 RepID=UPI0026256376|nr:hypothetical protein [uncultured Winogradskyella sp.]